MEMTKKMLRDEIIDLTKECDNIECLKMVYWIYLDNEANKRNICNKKPNTIQF